MKEFFRAAKECAPYGFVMLSFLVVLFCLRNCEEITRAKHALSDERKIDPNSKMISISPN